MFLHLWGELQNALRLFINLDVNNTYVFSTTRVPAYYSIVVAMIHVPSYKSAIATRVPFDLPCNWVANDHCFVRIFKVLKDWNKRIQDADNTHLRYYRVPNQ